MNDLLTIPLYHGTSSFFTDSILNHGLGAVNPLDNLKVLPFLRQAYELCEQLFEREAESSWHYKKIVIEKILNQEITQAGFNFRHGSTYLTPNCLTAVRYAINNRLGSEALSEAVELYRMLLKRDASISQYSEFKDSPIPHLLTYEIYPVLFEVQNININILRSESGENAKEVILKIENAVEQGIFDLINQQLNFKLIEPITSNNLKLYKIIIIKQDRIFPEYELQEIQT